MKKNNDAPNVIVIEVNAIIEIGVPKEKVASYKTKGGLETFLHNIHGGFCHNVEGFKGHKIYQTHYTGIGDYVTINNFGYSCNHECRKSSVHIVYRSFNGTFYIVKPADFKDDDDFFGTYKYEYKGCVIELCICGVKSKYLRDGGVKYIKEIKR